MTQRKIVVQPSFAYFMRGVLNQPSSMRDDACHWRIFFLLPKDSSQPFRPFSSESSRGVCYRCESRAKSR
jgi:hypothetical protein